MRVYTLTLSIVIHLAAVFALVVVPLVATESCRIHAARSSSSW